MRLSEINLENRVDALADLLFVLRNTKKNIATKNGLNLSRVFDKDTYYISEIERNLESGFNLLCEEILKYKKIYNKMIPQNDKDSPLKRDRSYEKHIAKLRQDFLQLNKEALNDRERVSLMLKIIKNTNLIQKGDNNEKV